MRDAVYSPVHLGHEIRSQTQIGVQVPASEIAERAEVIRDALAADGGFELIGPTEHGEDPITAVHDPRPRSPSCGTPGRTPSRPASRTGSSCPRPSTTRS